jgi:aerobic-type carbon monoxide dehydrogenase small subunit (CoxS/CutS family)
MRKFDFDRRIAAGLDRGEAFTFTFDGMAVEAYPGESVAAALIAHGRRKFRETLKREMPRGLYCGMGVCWECIMVIDGRAAVRACMTVAEPYMKVETQHGLGPSPNTAPTEGGAP